jgi:hypothetical protein
MSFPASLTRDDIEAFDTLDLLPLRQLVRVTHASRTALGGQCVLPGLSRPDRFRILRHSAGGQILARNGLALAEAQLLLRQACGAAIAFETPTAHRVLDHATGTTLVPVMFLRMDAPRAYRRDLLQMLGERSAEPREITIERDRIVLRTEMLLSRLIGLERQVLDHTDGAAHILCWLARYSPASEGGEGVHA